MDAQQNFQIFWVGLHSRSIEYHFVSCCKKSKNMIYFLSMPSKYRVLTNSRSILFCDVVYGNTLNDNAEPWKSTTTCTRNLILKTMNECLRHLPRGGEGWGWSLKRKLPLKSLGLGDNFEELWKLLVVISEWVAPNPT